MALTLVLGPANSAKAGEVLGAYSRAARDGALLVVPTAADANHYDRELAAGGVTLGRALTFGGLIDEIARRAAAVPGRLTALQRRLMLTRLLSDLELPALRASADTPGFADAAARLLSELRTARVSAPRFAAAIRQWAAERPHAAGYAEDLAALYLRYDRELSRAGVLDAESAAWSVLDALRARPAAWAATPVFFYGFDDLTAVELDAVRTLAGPAQAQITVSLTYEPGRRALRARATAVEELRAEASTVRELPGLDDYYAPAARVPLHHLERHLFEPGAPALDPGEAAELLEAGGELAEAELVAAGVLAALRECVPPAEIVVVCRSLTRSGALLEKTLERYGVPSASARHALLRRIPLGRALLAAVRCALDPDEASSSDVLTFLRYPGARAERARVDQLERDVRRLGLRTATQVLAVAQNAGLSTEQIDHLRASSVASAAIASMVRGLLRVDTSSLDAMAAAVTLDACAQVADASLAELHDLLATCEFPANDAQREAVLVAEPLAIRARRFRRVFVTGLCDGEFPVVGGGDPLLGDERRRELALASGVVLPAREDALDRERYLLYATVSRASEQVTFSYRSSDEDGNVVRPSPFLDDLVAVFGEAWRARRQRRLLADAVWPAELAPTEREYELALAAAGGAHGTPVRAIGRAETRVLGEAALSQVRHREVISGSALELFAICPVRWLVERQLEPEELAPESEPLAKGTFLHEVLERVLRRLGSALTEATLPAAERALDEELRVLPAQLAPGSPPAVRAAILRGIEADLRRYLRHEASDGCEWVPTELEYQFETTIGGELEGRPPLRFRGMIDRIDVSPDGRRAIVRDYKSGTGQDRAAARWTQGAVLQAGLYMLAVRKLLALEPVAGLYQPLTGRDLRPRGAFLKGAEVGRYAFSTDALEPEELESLLNEIEQLALELAATIRRGELTPCPQTCSRDGCAHPGICWA